MDAQELLDELTVPEGLPREALGWADAHRDELVPVFLDFLRRYIDEPDEPEVPTALFYVIHLLGSWREKRAYRLMAEVLRTDPERLDWDLGDSMTESVPRLMRNVFDGDPAPLYEVIECETVNEFMRGDLLALVAALAIAGEIPREDVARYLHDAYSRLGPQDENYVWVGWQEAIALLGLAELSSLVEHTFERGYIGEWNLSKEDFYEDLRMAQRDPHGPQLAERRNLRPFGSVIEELETWAFAKEAGADREAPENDPFYEGDALADYYPGEPVRNPLRHVGRNDPCPCGSGKKYKKCCLPLHESGTRA
jgi:hypothetical protein